MNKFNTLKHSARNAPPLIDENSEEYFSEGDESEPEDEPELVAHVTWYFNAALPPPTTVDPWIDLFE